MKRKGLLPGNTAICTACGSPDMADNGGVARTVEKYNKYFSPEAHAKLVSFEGDSFRILFTGSFCHTCGFYDYFDDFRIFLEELGVMTEIKDVEELDDGAIVRFESGNKSD